MTVEEVTRLRLPMAAHGHQGSCNHLVPPIWTHVLCVLGPFAWRHSQEEVWYSQWSSLRHHCVQISTLGRFLWATLQIRYLQMLTACGTTSVCSTRPFLNQTSEMDALATWSASHWYSTSTRSRRAWYPSTSIDSIPTLNKRWHCSVQCQSANSNAIPNYCSRSADATAPLRVPKRQLNIEATAVRSQHAAPTSIEHARLDNHFSRIWHLNADNLWLVLCVIMHPPASPPKFWLRGGMCFHLPLEDSNQMGHFTPRALQGITLYVAAGSRLATIWQRKTAFRAELVPRVQLIIALSSCAGDVMSSQWPLDLIKNVCISYCYSVEYSTWGPRLHAYRSAQVSTLRCQEGWQVRALATTSIPILLFTTIQVFSWEATTRWPLGYSREVCTKVSRRAVNHGTCSTWRRL